jgi:UDP-N-acetylmuramoyl-L-alanyl-D-glutamate--2,6-diaminopimelate ligase
MRLRRLLAALPDPVPYDGPDPEITGVVYDSRRARPGSLFVARKHRGYALDPHDFVPPAFANGAVAAVVQRPVAAPAGAPLIVVPDPARALGWLAAAFYGFPAARLGLVGVTGTDGKTTTCALTTAVLEADPPNCAGFPTGMISTVASKGVGPVRDNPAHTSTPEAVEVQALLAETVAGGGTRAVVEATSHALDQDRLAGCELDVAVVTRVTHEHLDYHGTPEAYLAAKSRLLDLLRPDGAHPKSGSWPKAAVLNADDASYEPLAARSPAPVLRFGLTSPAADVRALSVRDTGWGTAFRVVSPWGEGELALPLPGAFNVYNALAALAAGCTLGAPFHAALGALERHPGVSGRMQRVDAGQPFAVVVDFAHTPDALTQVLSALRRQTPGRLIVVFGSAGERDRAKRPWMGRLAAELADFFVVTDEDPRLEPREVILAEIAAGARKAGAVEGGRFLLIPDRGEAVFAALERARPGDTVLLAGKGHERSLIGALDGELHTFPWDESAAARAALRRLGYG